MEKVTKHLDCHIGSLVQPHEDPYLDSHGFSRGMILFAIPSYGILFKCRAEGEAIDLEFGAFFAVLQFIRDSLAEQKIRQVRISSSNPQFIFSIINRTASVATNPQRQKILAEYMTFFEVALAYVPVMKNKTMIPPNEYPSMPQGQTAPLSTSPADSKAQFKPIQKGIFL